MPGRTLHRTSYLNITGVLTQACPWTGHIGYALAPLIARGQMCGPQQQVILRMHDREQAAQNLAAVQMELDDLASDLLLGEYLAVLELVPSSSSSSQGTDTDQ